MGREEIVRTQQGAQAKQNVRETQNAPELPQLAAGHAVRLENREKLSVAGVLDVAGFDESMVVLSTALGDLTVRGEGLHMEKIDLEAGRLELHGKLTELSYDEPAAGRGLWARLFG